METIKQDAIAGAVAGIGGKVLDKVVRKGVIYEVPGTHTPSGKPYIGKTDNLKKRAASAKDGRDRSEAKVVDRYVKGDKKGGSKAEQKAMNDRGGKKELDNKRDEIAKDKWPESGIKPPKQ